MKISWAPGGQNVEKNIGFPGVFDVLEDLESHDYENKLGPGGQMLNKNIGFPCFFDVLEDLESRDYENKLGPRRAKC